ncbi:hypothetical protein O3M35_011940 [Rhynocoris fuscipes]|uniref:Reverse transcriptase zinc-binding domain-containing protein n=1 Tax=Rhynocoris fuscipes TaxID=488301 RepID=A0AAW1CXG1_9HEMI
MGHTRLTHGYLMTRCPQTLCNTPLSIKHLFTSCPRYSVTLNRFNLPLNLSQLLSDSLVSPTNLNPQPFLLTVTTINPIFYILKWFIRANMTLVIVAGKKRKKSAPVFSKFSLQ